MARRKHRGVNRRSRRSSSKRSLLRSMFEALERRYLFSLGASAPPPAVEGPAYVAAVEIVGVEPAPPAPDGANARGPMEVGAPGSAHVIPANPIFAETVVAAPAMVPSGFDAEDLQDYVRADSSVAVLLLAPDYRPPPAQSPAAPLTGASSASPYDENHEDAPASDGRAFSLAPTLVPYFAPAHEEANFARLAVNLFNRLETNEGPKAGPLVGFDSRLQADVTPATASAGHAGGLATRTVGDWPTLELQLRRPMEAPGGSQGQTDRLAGASVLAALVGYEESEDQPSEYAPIPDGLWTALAAPDEARIDRPQGEAHGAAPAPADEPAAAWGSLLPMMPHFSAADAHLSEAFQAVFADLDELGGEIVSSLADPDRIIWGLGAAGIGYYVAGFRRANGNRSSDAASPDGSRHLPRRRPLAFARLHDR